MPMAFSFLEANKKAFYKNGRHCHRPPNLMIAWPQFLTLRSSRVTGHFGTWLFSQIYYKVQWLLPV